MNPVIAGEDAGYLRVRVRGRRDRTLRRQSPERPRRGEPAPDDGRDVARGFGAACCGSTATRGCGGSRITATKREHAYDRGPDDTFGGGCCECAAAARRRAPARRRAAREHGARLPREPARAGGRVRIARATGGASSSPVRPAAQPTAPEVGSLAARTTAATHHGGRSCNAERSYGNRCSRSLVAAALCAPAPPSRRPCSSSATPTSPAARARRPPNCSRRRSSSTRRAATRCRSIPAGQLANDPKGVEQLQLGGIDFTVTGTGTYATHIPTLNLTALPFIVESYPQGWKLYDESKWMQAQFAKGPEKGFRFLSPFEAGLPLDDDEGSAGHAGRRQGQEAAQLPQRDDALAARGDGLQRADHAAAGGLPRDPAGRGERAGEPDRHDPRQQVLRSRAERDADAARLQSRSR